MCPWTLCLFSSLYIYLAYGRSFTLVSTLHLCVRKSYKKVSENQNSISKAKAHFRKIYIENIQTKNLEDAERLVLIIAPFNSLYRRQKSATTLIIEETKMLLYQMQYFSCSRSTQPLTFCM